MVDGLVNDNRILNTQPVAVGFVFETEAVDLGACWDFKIPHAQQANLWQLDVR